MSGPARVLVVDDEPLVRDSLTDFLEDEGFQVCGADSAEQALAMLSAQPFDLAVVDVRLPKMDGNALIAAAHRLHPRLGFLVLTSSVDYVLPRELRAFGMTSANVLHKPLAGLRLMLQAMRKELNRGGDDESY